MSWLNFHQSISSTKIGFLWAKIYLGVKWWATFIFEKGDSHVMEGNVTSAIFYGEIWSSKPSLKCFLILTSFGVWSSFILWPSKRNRSELRGTPWKKKTTNPLAWIHNTCTICWLNTKKLLLSQCDHIFENV